MPRDEMILLCFYSNSIKISLTSLNALLKDRGCVYDNKKNLAKCVAAAYKYWEKRDRVRHHAIAYLFTDKDGEFAWEKYL
jgi:hypothetical protein